MVLLFMAWLPFCFKDNTNDISIWMTADDEGAGMDEQQCLEEEALKAAAVPSLYVAMKGLLPTSKGHSVSALSPATARKDVSADGEAGSKCPSTPSRLSLLPFLVALIG